MRHVLICVISILGLACNKDREKVLVPANTPNASVQPARIVAPSTQDEPKIDLQSPIDPPALKPPPIALIKPWLELKEIPTDLAIGCLWDSCAIFDDVLLWPVTSDKPVKFGKFRHPSGSQDRSEDGALRGANFFDYPAWNNAAPTRSIAVYVKMGPWCLVHDTSEGWLWLLLRGYEPIEHCGNPWSVYDEPWRSALIRIQNPHPIENSNGITNYVSIDKIEPMPNEILRDAPSLTAKEFGFVNGKFFKMTSIVGDWVQVQEASSVAFGLTLDGNNSNGGLQIRWNPKRIGWIRWRVPGPIPGSYHVRLRGIEHYTYSD